MKKPVLGFLMFLVGLVLLGWGLYSPGVSSATSLVRSVRERCSPIILRRRDPGQAYMACVEREMDAQRNWARTLTRQFLDYRKQFRSVRRVPRNYYVLIARSCSEERGMRRYLEQALRGMSRVRRRARDTKTVLSMMIQDINSDVTQFAIRHAREGKLVSPGEYGVFAGVFRQTANRIRGDLDQLLSGVRVLMADMQRTQVQQGCRKPRRQPPATVRRAPRRRPPGRRRRPPSMSWPRGSSSEGTLPTRRRRGRGCGWAQVGPRVVCQCNGQTVSGSRCRGR